LVDSTDRVWNHYWDHYSATCFLSRSALNATIHFPQYLPKSWVIMQLMNPSQSHQTTRLSSVNPILQILLIGLVLSIVLSFLAPSFDHHYAERQHNHSHVFLNTSSAIQGHPDFHPFEQSHHHFESDEHQHEGDGILYQPSYDIFGDSGSLLTVFENNNWAHINDSLSLVITTTNTSPLENGPAPPTRPPIS